MNTITNNESESTFDSGEGVEVMAKSEALLAKEAEVEELKAKIAAMEAANQGMTSPDAPIAEVDPEKDPNRRVPIRLFKDNDKYKDPLFVSVNGYRATIPRGETVYIPYFALLAIEESMAQDQSTATMIARLTESFEVKSNGIV